VIRVENVTKNYGPVRAVDAASFRVGQGVIVGVLGPNGAGKSTVLKMISTWLPPDSGAIAVAGHDVVREPLAVRRSLGYLSEHNALYDGMRVDRFLSFVGRVRSLSGAKLRQRMEWVIAKCSLDSVTGKRIHECSKGYRQRIGVAAALLHDPPVVVLDEPTHGLDPVQTAAFRDFVRGLREGRAILFSSHVLSEVVAISDRVLVIQAGRLLADAPLSELRAQAGAAGREVEAVLLDIVKSQETAA
jgi:ABC-2 type transport system ATP-binding protein